MTFKYISDLELCSIATLILKNNGHQLEDSNNMFEAVDAIEDKFGWDIEQFKEIASHLMYLTPCIYNDVTDENFHAFGSVKYEKFSPVALKKFEG